MSGQGFDALLWSAAIIAASVVIATASEFEDQHDMEYTHLAVKGAGLHQKWGCAEEDEWKGSCDIDGKGNVLHRADWSFNCDPWSQGVWANSANNSGVNFSHGNWTCPIEYRSPSGCGDFRTDPRNMTCDHPVSLDHSQGCFERVLIEVAEPLVPQKHVCVQHPIFFDNYNTAGAVTPPIVGRHREAWPKWGEYEYIPPQRWLHAMEHGGIIFLYHHCLDERSLCSLRTFIRKWQLKMERGDMDGGKFRFILTPAKDLQRDFAMVTWGETYLSKCFNENEMDIFIQLHYRRAWEDYGGDGKYDYLWIGLQNNTNCSLQVAAARPVDFQTKVESGALKAAADNLVPELIQLRKEQQTLQWVTAAAFSFSVCSLFALVAVLLRVRQFLKGKHGLQYVDASDESDAA